ELDGGAIASVEVSRMATGAKNRLTVELYGSAGALRFDLENPNELWFLDATRPIAEQGFTRVLVTEPEHPYLEAWWPQGHVLGWEHAFSNQARDLLLAIAGDPVSDAPTPRFSPDFSDGLALQRVLDAIIASDAADGATVALWTDRTPTPVHDGASAHPAHRPVGRSHPGRGRRAGGRLGVRRPRDRRLRRASRCLPLGRRRVHRRAAGDPGEARAEVLDDLQPPQGTGDLR